MDGLDQGAFVVGLDVLQYQPVLRRGNGRGRDMVARVSRP